VTLAPQIRRASSADVDIVRDLRIAFLADVRGVSPSSFPADFQAETTDFLRRVQRGGLLHSWLARVESADVGVVSMLVNEVPPRPEERRTREGYILNMYVEPMWRGRGIGRILLDACLASAQELGLRRFVLHSTDDARAMYETSGFAASPDWMQRPEMRL
jgi:ribosomal protein S18 acetylase RimI-like enzyme